MANVFQNYDPYKEAKFKQSYTGDNQEFVLMNKDGVPMVATDSEGVTRLVMGPAIFLKRKTLIEWFKSVYPDGSIDEELISYEAGKVILKVSLYKNFQRTEFLASSHGIALEKNHFYDVFRDLSSEGTENSADLYNLAFYLGLKQAMERTGFVLNYDPEFLMENVPGYKQACHTGEKADGDDLTVSLPGASDFADPDEETLAQEKKILELEKEIKEVNKITIEPDSKPSPVKKPKKNMEVPDEIPEGVDPIQEFLASIETAKAAEIETTSETVSEEKAPEVKPSLESKDQPVKEPVTDEATPEEKAEVAEPEQEPEPKTGTETETGELGNKLFRVSELASMKLKAYDGEPLKNLPREFLEYVASKEWNGKIDQDMIDTIKEYLR